MEVKFIIPTQSLSSGSNDQSLGYFRYGAYAYSKHLGVLFYLDRQTGDRKICRVTDSRNGYYTAAIYGTFEFDTEYTLLITIDPSTNQGSIKLNDVLLFSGSVDIIQENPEFGNHYGSGRIIVKSVKLANVM